MWSELPQDVFPRDFWPRDKPAGHDAVQRPEAVAAHQRQQRLKRRVIMQQVSCHQLQS